MSKIKNDEHSGRAALILAVVFVGVFCSVFFADKGRFELPFSTPSLMTVLAPFQRAASWVGGKYQDITSDVWDMITLHEQNKMLRNEVRELREQNRKAAEYAAENSRLRELLGYKNSAGQFDLMICSVIGREAATWTSVITVNKGSNDGIKKNMAAVTNHGLIGHVTEVGPVSCRIELVTDPRAAVAVLDQRSRIAGIVQGDIADIYRARMVNIPRSADVAVGDTIVTSGFGGIYPKGLVVGTVSEVKNDAGGLLKYAILESSADLQKLEDVAIIIASRESAPEPLTPPAVTPGTENLDPYNGGRP